MDWLQSPNIIHSNPAGFYLRGVEGVADIADHIDGFYEV